MIRETAIVATLLAANCTQNDETFTAYTPQGTYVLSEINGAAALFETTLTVGENGQFSGRAACNSYDATSTAPYPWFEIAGIATTKMACPNLTRERTYFTALQSMTLAESSGKILILSNDANETLTFTRQTP